MRTAYNESDRSVFNDYEESIIFDEDDPDFRRSDDLECICNKNGKLIYKLSLSNKNEVTTYAMSTFPGLTQYYPGKTLPLTVAYV
ncbi:hypothetical protein QTP88_017844 [Uroleucon formosanum]